MNVVQRKIPTFTPLKLGAIFLLALFIVVMSFVIFGVISIPFMEKKSGETSQKPALFGPKPGSCLILEQKFCDQLQLLDSPNYKGEKMAFAKLPSGTTIFAPENGKFEVADTLALKSKKTGKFEFETGYNFFVYPSDNTTNPSKIYSIIVPRNPGKKLSKNMEKGTLMESVGDKGLISISDYNFVITVSQFSQEQKTYVNITPELLTQK